MAALEQTATDAQENANSTGSAAGELADMAHELSSLATALET